MFSAIADTIELMFKRPIRSQFAALCWRKTPSGQIEVLLVTSRDTGRWVIPKGWPMGNKPGHAVAEQEAFEEAGMCGRVEHEPVGSYEYDKVMDEGLKIPCRVKVYAMEVTDMRKDFKEKSVRRQEWVSCEEAARRVQEPALKSLLAAFPARFAA